MENTIKPKKIKRFTLASLKRSEGTEREDSNQNLKKDRLKTEPGFA